MSRGDNPKVPEDASAILFGESGTNRPRQLFEEQIEDGVILYSDASGQVVKIKVPAGIYYKVKQPTLPPPHIPGGNNPSVRLDGPCLAYLENELLHREDGPAIEDPEGGAFYYYQGRLHREDGPAVVNSAGTEAWWLHGRRHREDGPALIQPDSSKEYYIDNQLHREDGPAVEEADGSTEYWLCGVEQRPESFEHALDQLRNSRYYQGAANRRQQP